MDLECFSCFHQVSALSSLVGGVLELHPLISSASALQSLRFEDGAVPMHHHVSIALKVLLKCVLC